MADPAISVRGAKELQRTLAKAGVDVKDFRDVHRKVAGYVGAEGAQRAPRQTGQLAASWRPGATKTNAVVRFGGSAIPYANAVHWGTGARAGRRGPHNIAPTLFATTAAAETEPTWLEWYFAELNQILDHVKGTTA